MNPSEPFGAKMTATFSDWKCSWPGGVSKKLAMSLTTTPRETIELTSNTIRHHRALKAKKKDAALRECMWLHAKDVPPARANGSLLDIRLVVVDH
eukprot:CAMPEP_0194536990 /NCGR_PEP_ID=MMETSP0253-20130528/76114_1 /TAXON_ID=2966 /ORGANISM="Noctiluca scintillans" /LENGTH=94 /DNA_ID=CAMNT_0039382967 /DNA_START=264 /DNA_END=546 /DNA_ORIENTATION=-